MVTFLTFFAIEKKIISVLFYLVHESKYERQQSSISNKLITIHEKFCTLKKQNDE
jgi:hypothetical protein